ncbi:unnamed protein product [Meganyctiphanes norvegica]|uniref:TLC domain-containing protein n=1 Tax=Meganyctiphanes norvegica TaxID=48144 RepID=A0AAV2RJQ3_MEGNR
MDGHHPDTVESYMAEGFPGHLNQINQHTITAWLRNISAWFWRPEIWLLKGVSWENIQPTSEFNYRNFYDPFTYPLVIAAFILIFRILILNPYIFEPLALKSVVIKKRRKPVENIPILEILYKNNTRKSTTAIREASLALGWSERKVERWLRHKKKASQMSTYDKFVDCAFEFTFHLLFEFAGTLILYKKPWLWDMSLCWQDWPHHAIDDDIWWFFMVGMAYFWSLIVIHASTRKDRTQMMIHHATTIFLMTFSWVCNFIRIGTLVLMSHEYVDLPIMASKMFQYAGKPKYNEPCYAVFIILWIILRLIIFPFWILYSGLYDPYAQKALNMPAAYVFTCLLSVLMILNITWTLIIIRIGVRKLTGGTVRDIRSSTEDSDNGNKTE